MTSAPGNELSLFLQLLGPHAATVFVLNLLFSPTSECTVIIWANAKRGGRPAEYRWHTLLNAVDQIVKIFAPGKILSGGKSPPPQKKMYIECTSP